MRKPRSTPQRQPLDTPSTPSGWGRYLAQRGSLKGLPYGPGGRQEEALRAYRSATSEAV